MIPFLLSIEARNFVYLEKFTGAVSFAKILEFKFELLQHPPYLPDFVSSDFISFKL